MVHNCSFCTGKTCVKYKLCQVYYYYVKLEIFKTNSNFKYFIRIENETYVYVCFQS